MKPRTLTCLVVAVLAVVAAAIAVPAVVGRHDGDRSPVVADPGPALDPGAASLLRVHPTRTASPTALGAVTPLTGPEQDFSFRLLAKLAVPGHNTTVSPASLAIALSMLQLGARGHTEREIATALGTTGMSATRQAQAWQSVRSAWTSAARRGGLDLQTADSLWQQTGQRIEHRYLTQLADYFDTGVWQTDFRHHLPAALDAINRWTSTHTHGRITKLFEPGMLDASTRLVLADAVYFKADWQQPFDARATSAGTFTRTDGTHGRAEFMHGQRLLRSATTSTYQAVELPYQGGRFAALAVMPRSGSLSSFVGSLDAATLTALVRRLHAGEVDLALPTFETGSVSDLNGALKSLGMATSFSDGADLSGIGRDLHVQQAIQRTYLKVAEKGTEAAAVTGIGVVAGAAPSRETTLRFDHPFLFLIRDNATGTVLFASQIENPAA